MEMSGSKKKFLVIFALVLIASSFSLGAAFGYYQKNGIEEVLGISNQQEPITETVDFSTFWAVWRKVEEEYAITENINRQEMVWGAINGMLGSLDDPYTVFFPPEEKKMFESEVKGSFEGVGMEIANKEGILTVITPIKGSPALAAGIKSGDKILKINDTSTEDMSVEAAVKLIRGEKGTSVKLFIFSEGDEKAHEVTVVRDTIRVPILETKKINNVFLIELHSFSENSPFEFQNSLRQFVASGADKLIIDVRNNPGGYLEAAVDISSWFLETGEVVLREKYRDGEERLHRSKGYNAFPDVPLIILTNEGSASASEILAGALRDNGKAKLVGTKTFGKGSVQELIPITRDTSLKMTIARWLTPNGEDIGKQGIEPDFSVERTAEDVKAERDPQLDKALEVLSAGSAN